MTEKKDLYEISKIIQTTTGDIDKRIDSFIKPSFMKRILRVINKNNELKQLETAMDFFVVKKSELIQYRNDLKVLNVELNEENKNLEKEIKKMKRLKDPDKEILIQMETKLVINHEMQINEIPILIELIENILVKLEKTLPFIERTIKQRLSINTSLKTLKFVIEKTVELENYSKKLEKENSKEIKNLVTSSTDLLINSIDVDYYKDMHKRNRELNKLFNDSKDKYNKKLIKLEKELSSIISKNDTKEIK